MDSNASGLESALSVLRQQYGEQLPGPQESALAQMRETLRQQMSLDERTADRLLTDLRNTGRLVYVANRDRDRDRESGTSDTGPVISLPGTLSGGGGGELILTASPAEVMGLVDEEGGNTARDIVDIADNESESEAEEFRPVTTLEDQESNDDSGQGYWRIG